MARRDADGAVEMPMEMFRCLESLKKFLFLLVHHESNPLPRHIRLVVTNPDTPSSTIIYPVPDAYLNPALI